MLCLSAEVHIFLMKKAKTKMSVGVFGIWLYTQEMLYISQVQERVGAELCGKK